MKVISDTRVPIKIWTNDIEAEAETQLRSLSDLPFIYKHVAVMPDVHAGRGSTIGTVIATKGAIIPSAVGVDIGCGMCALKLPLKIDELKDLPKLRHSIERSVPTGRHVNNNICDSAIDFFNQADSWSPLAQVKMNERTKLNALKSIGTLGGGNHFIEICQDQHGDAWILLHSGSRNIGKCLADIHIDKAKGLMKQYFINLPDPELAYLAQGTADFDQYINDVDWAQKFAMENRNEIMDRTLREVLYHSGRLNEYKSNKDLYFRVNCHHNYISIENHYGHNVYITRKGAVSARAEQWGIIPGSMGSKSYIVKGLGNDESFHSCSHGAGRRMSRTKARATFTVEDLKKQTEGVECNKSSSVLDEIPGAYKSIDEVMDNQRDLVAAVYELKQVVCIKGTD